MGINYKILGKNIKYYRKQNNLTQEQMAESLELSGDLLTLYEQIPKKDQTLFYYMLKAYVDHL